MKRYLYIMILFAAALVAGCEHTDDDLLPEDPQPSPEVPGNVPDGYFVATFSGFLPETKAPINGSTDRVQTLRYILYEESGAFVKERLLFSANGASTGWPYTVQRDTLPLGKYKAVFLGNTEKTLFPYPTGSTTTGYNDVLLNYHNNYADARIALPNSEFKSNSEYYWARVPFSNTTPSRNVLLQRIIGMENVHRNVVDAREALDSLLSNIVTELHYKNLLQTTARGILTTEVKRVVGEAIPAITITLLGGVDAIANPIIDKLVNPVVDTLYHRLLKGLTDQIGLALQANENQNGLLGVLGELLNPWEFSQAHTAIVTINNFPKTIDFDLNIWDKYTGLHKFRYDFVNDAFFAQKCLYIKNFSGLFDIREINVIKQGLISGVVFDGIVDGPLLLNGAFIDIKDPLVMTPAANRRYKANYSFVDLGLKSYTAQTDGNHNLTVTVQLTEIANLNGLLGGIPILNGIVNLLLSPLRLIKVAVPLNLPLLGIDNLSLSGGWSTPVSY